MPYASPSILFIETANSPERVYLRSLLTRLRSNGYTRLVEPCCGSFRIPLVAVSADWPAKAIECSDVSLYSAAIGTMLAGGDLRQLGVRLDGEHVQLPDIEPAGQAAFILWLQLLTRMEMKSDVAYFRELAEDLLDRAKEHQRAIASKLTGLDSRLHGLSFRAADLLDHVAAVADDPRAVVFTEPPTYTAGYEKFYDTAGRLSWNEPPYGLWDVDGSLRQLHDYMDGKAALLLCSEQREPGHAVGKPVYARHLSLGQYIYLTTNRPQEVLPLAGGPKVYPRNATEIYPADFPVLSPEAEIAADADVRLYPVKPGVADYYRQLWMHRLVATPGSDNLLVVINGRAAGVLAYNLMFGLVDNRILMRFAYGAPHAQLRLGRLMTMLALQLPTAERAMQPKSAIYLAAADGVFTSNFTPHPESKFYRGLMKLARKEKGQDGYKLTYVSDWGHDKPGDVLRRFLAKEATWRARSSQ